MRDIKKTLVKSTFSLIISLLLVIFFNMQSGHADFKKIYAYDNWSPYGISKFGRYGESRGVKSPDEARKILKDYFEKKQLRIGEIREKELYYEAEIYDKKDNLIDKVIIDKRSGRIRSIY